MKKIDVLIGPTDLLKQVDLATWLSLVNKPQAFFPTPAFLQVKLSVPQGYLERY